MQDGFPFQQITRKNGAGRGEIGNVNASKTDPAVRSCRSAVARGWRNPSAPGQVTARSTSSKLTVLARRKCTCFGVVVSTANREPNRQTNHAIVAVPRPKRGIDDFGLCMPRRNRLAPTATTVANTRFIGKPSRDGVPSTAVQRREFRWADLLRQQDRWPEPDYLGTGTICIFRGCARAAWPAATTVSNNRDFT